MSINLRWLLVVALSALVGCNNSSNSASPAVVTAPANPPAPALGTAIDRVGRPAILTALFSTFEEPTTRGVNRNAYNAAPRSDWKLFTNDIRSNLALYDGLDAQCGNQILADLSLVGPDRYNTLASVLTDDRVYVNTASNSCSQYLGVELDATNLAPNEECGGRTPTHDVIDVSYTALVNDLSFLVTDGVSSDNVGQSLEIFPFLATFVPSPEPPTLGGQVDRVGRAAITAALISPFDNTTAGTNRDTYNRTPKDGWAQFSSQIGESLAAYDGLDGMCGNQILVQQAETGAARYATLASVLADDRLYLASSQDACSQYLAVELQVTNLLPNTDCGGRTPVYDTIDTSYTVLINDLSVGVTKATDGVPTDDVVSSTAIFPYLQPK